MNRYVGGFLELELFAQPGAGYHAKALGFHNARACVSHLIRQTGMRAVWLPYYTCNALLQPFEDAGVPYRFYALDQQLELLEVPVLGPGEYLVYVNYFGLKASYVRRLLDRYDAHLLVDDTQDYFARGYGAGWSFNSARKSFGVPDGGYLYGPADQLGTAAEYPVNASYQVQHLVDRLRGDQNSAYQAFVAYERTLGSAPLQISALASSLLSQVNYEAVAAQRRANYRRYHAALAPLNDVLSLPLSLDELPPETVPFCYPLVPRHGELVDRKALFEQGIFVAWLWPDVLTRQPESYAWERQLTRALLPLPVDHRYGPTEVDRVVAAVQALVAATAADAITSTQP